MARERTDPPPRRAGGRWALALAYLALIHLASSISPGEDAVPLPWGVDKLVHLCEFGILVGLFWRPLRDALPGLPEMRVAAALVIFAAANGLADEFHQAFVPGRDPSWADAAADMIGAAASIPWLLHREKARLALPRPPGPRAPVGTGQAG